MLNNKNNEFKLRAVGSQYLPKLTKEHFLTRARAKHGDKYGYSKIDYYNMTKPIDILCPIHGYIVQKPYNHLNSNGCPKCSKTYKKDTHLFIADSIKTHGNCYGYDKVNYINDNHKVIITCRKHGDFEQTPSNHVAGQGCKKCGREKVADTLRYNKERVIEEIVKILPPTITHRIEHYSSSADRLNFTCSIHGNFTQTLQHLRNGKFCPKCGHIRGGDKTRSSTDKFIAQSKKCHGDRYIYDKTIYVNTDTPLTVTCRKHGDFTTWPRNHYNGANCPKCNVESIRDRCVKDVEKFKEEGAKKHNNFYTYDNVINYVNNKTDVMVTCPLHGDFPVRPDNHLGGLSGCPICKQSKGEKKISDLLTSMDIVFKRQYTIPNSNFRYDFYLPEYNMLIEYDGALHFKAVEHFGGEAHLNLTKYRDLMKNRLAKKNGYILLRIHYRMFKQLEQNLLDKISKYYKYYYKNKFIKKVSDLSYFLEEDGIKNVLFSNYSTNKILSIKVL